MPPAPRPTYNSNGNRVQGWHVHLGYDEASDQLYVSWVRPGTEWRRSSHHEDRFPPHDLEDVIARVQRIVRTLGARRLF